MESGRFYFLYGNDAYAIQQRAQEVANTFTQDTYTVEIFQPQGTAIADAERCLWEAQNAMRYRDLFSPRRVLWLRHIDFLADTPTGRSEVVREAIETFLSSWQHAEEMICILSACPVDRRTKIFKQLDSLGHSEFFPEAKTSTELLPWVRKTCQQHSITIDEEALELLCHRVGFSRQALSQEIEKLSLYIGINGHITLQEIQKLVPELIPGEFFEAVDLFYSADLETALQGLRRYFIYHKEARPLLSALQHRNRLMIALRYFVETGELHLRQQRLSKSEWEQLAAQYSSLFSQEEKSSFHIFQQNFWYLSRLAKEVTHFPLEVLLRFQKKFTEILFKMIRFHDHTASIMEELFRYGPLARSSSLCSGF
ncbi:MAG: DNA polymerase III subunit delta [Puniceicoccales bacterium]|jgi:DNA polymerase-3 subunit delta|nr:DNA polymerase III subunit delta [Puniceicoccales bacterium]